MRRRLPRTLALPAAVALLLFLAPPAIADTTIPTTPLPQPVSPGQPPVSAPEGPQPLGHAVGDAAASLGIVRLLPNAVPTGTIFPAFDEQLPRQSALEVGMGLSNAQANSEAYLSWERAVANSAPGGLSVVGDAPQGPGGLAQVALPDNPQPLTAGLTAPPNPLINAGLFNGSVHAKWSPTLGPCVGTIADATTSAASMSLLNTIPTAPNLPVGKLAGLPPLASGFDPSSSLQTLGGLLSGSSSNQDGTGSLVSLPGTMSSHSVMRLVDLPNSANKAVESVSMLQAGEIDLFKGTPLELTLRVTGQPKLRVTSTGDQATSKVEYTAPVITIERQGQVLYTLDAAHPTKDIPIGLPLKALDQLGTAAQGVPVIGGLVTTANGLRQLSDTAGLVLDIGVLRLNIAELNQNAQQLTTPFAGFQLGASARMLDLRVLPTKALQGLLPAGTPALPYSFAQVSLGEQIGRAYAPTGGVVCGSTPDSATPVAAPIPPDAGNLPTQLAYTSGAYSAVPMFWTGSALLLLGAIMIAFAPARRPAKTPVKPSPHPRVPGSST